MGHERILKLKIVKFREKQKFSFEGNFFHDGKFSQKVQNINIMDYLGILKLQFINSLRWKFFLIGEITESTEYHYYELINYFEISMDNKNFPSWENVSHGVNLPEKCRILILWTITEFRNQNFEISVEYKNFPLREIFINGKIFPKSTEFQYFGLFNYFGIKIWKFLWKIKISLLGKFFPLLGNFSK